MVFARCDWRGDRSPHDQALITATECKARLAQRQTGGLSHEFRTEGDAPVIKVTVAQVEMLTADVALYELRATDGADLPPRKCRFYRYSVKSALRGECQPSFHR